MDSRQPEWTNQELRDVVYREGKVPGYKIAKDGLVISYKQYKDGKALKWWRRSKSNDYPAVGLQIPEELVGHAINYKSSKYLNAKAGNIQKDMNVHTLVADAWLDTENNCPEHLKPWWDDLDKDLQKELRQYFFVDHIDNDTWNPHVSNLKFVSSRHNQVNIKIAMSKEQMKNSS